MDYFRKGIRKGVKFLGERRILSLSTVIRLLHLIEMLRWPDLKNPQDINEKLMWMELYSDTSEWSRLADKYKVREYVKEKGFEKNLIPFYGEYDKYNQIDFERLPESFVIKSRNGCAQTAIIRDKKSIDHKKLKKEISGWLKRPFGYSTGEKHYTTIPKGLVVEKLMTTSQGNLPIDYKFYCFNGEVKACLVCTDRKIRTQEYNLNLMDVSTWEEIPDSIIPSRRGNPDFIPQPKRLEEMRTIASGLSEGFPFVRVDLYEIDGRVYFGEMTFTPAGCHSHNLMPSILRHFGEKIKDLKRS